MQIRLSDHFTYKRLLRFTLPSVVTMIIASVYSVVDGLFVSNLVGAMALSAINIAFPVAMIIGSVGFMLGTGGSALVAKTLGEGKKELANQYFSMLIYSMLIIGGILTHCHLFLFAQLCSLPELVLFLWRTVSFMGLSCWLAVSHLCYRSASRISLW